MKKTTLIPLGVLFAAAVLFTGCGDETKAENKPAAIEQPATTEEPTTTEAPPPTVAPTAPPTTAAPAPPPTVAPTTTPPPPPPAATMPNVVCMNLQDAQDRIQESGVFFSTSHDATGMGRSQLIDSNWQVVSQNPPAGSPIGEGDADLGAVKYGEASPC